MMEEKSQAHQRTARRSGFKGCQRIFWENKAGMETEVERGGGARGKKCGLLNQKNSKCCEKKNPVGDEKML